MVLSIRGIELGQNSTHTIATFTGTLLKREKSSDNKLVQLVFREGDKNWLCVSTNLADSAWPVGRTYKVQGTFKHMGERPYIYQPTIAALKQKRTLKSQFTFTRVLVSAVVLVAIVSAIGVYSVLKPSNDGQVKGASTSKPGQATAEQAKTDASSQDTAVQADQPSATTTPPVATTTTTQNSTTTTNNPVTTQPPKNPVVTPPVVTPPAPDCDTSAAIPFQVEEQPADEDHPAGTVIREGVVGEQQTCYPNGRSAAGVVTIIQAPVNKIITV